VGAHRENQPTSVLRVPSAPAFHTHALSVRVNNQRRNIINGLKLIETWESGTGDRIDGNGSLMLHSVFVMENGDRFIARLEGPAQTSTHFSSQVSHDSRSG
jgi:hypothetical protein